MKDILLAILENSKEEHFDNISDTGADDYFEKSTKDEIYSFGYFRALEDLEDYIERYL